MTDKQVLAILAEGYPIHAVLLNRGWLHGAQHITIELRFPATDDACAIWRIDLHDDQEQAYRSIYTAAETIAGISCRRHTGAADSKGDTHNGTEQKRSGQAAQGEGQPGEGA